MYSSEARSSTMLPVSSVIDFFLSGRRDNNIKYWDINEYNIMYVSSVI